MHVDVAMKVPFRIQNMYELYETETGSLGKIWNLNIFTRHTLFTEQAHQEGNQFKIQRERNQANNKRF